MPAHRSASPGVLASHHAPACGVVSSPSRVQHNPGVTPANHASVASLPGSNAARIRLTVALLQDGDQGQRLAQSLADSPQLALDLDPCRPLGIPLADQAEEINLQVAHGEGLRAPPRQPALPIRPADFRAEVSWVGFGANNLLRLLGALAGTLPG